MAAVSDNADHMGRIFTDVVAQVSIPPPKKKRKAREDEIRNARAAVVEMFSEFERRTTDGRILAPNFASHSADHALALAVHLRDTILPWLPAEVPSPVRDLECLVLLFSAFMWHDAGMAKLPEAMTDVAIDDIWSYARVRNGHDERSRQMVESLNIKDLNAWSTFWDARQGPRPVEESALLLLARICQSHGDNGSGWLNKIDLDRYHKLSGDRAVVSFPDQWGVHWTDVSAWHYAAAALLNICDLLDVREGRLDLVQQGLWEHALAEEPSVRRQTFLHWVGHRLVSVDWRDGQIRLTVASLPDTPPLQCALALRAGPTSDLLHWGTEPQIATALHDWARVEYNGMKIVHGAVDRTLASQVSDYVTGEPFAVCWVRAIELLELVGRVPPPRSDAEQVSAVVQVEWLRLLMSVIRGAQDVPFNEVRLALQLLRGDVPLDLLVDGSVFEDMEASGRVVMRVAGSVSGSQRVAEAFLGAVRLMREIESRPYDTEDQSIRPLQPFIAHKGNKPHQSLMNRQHNPHSPGRVVTIVCLHRDADVREYRTLITPESSDLIVFCCQSAEQEAELSRMGASSADVRPKEAVLREVARSIEAIKIPKPPDQEPEIVRGDASDLDSEGVIGLAIELCKRDNAYQLAVGAINDLVRATGHRLQLFSGRADNPTDEQVEGQGLLVWLTLAAIYHHLDGYGALKERIGDTYEVWTPQLGTVPSRAQIDHWMTEHDLDFVPDDEDRRDMARIAIGDLVSGACTHTDLLAAVIGAEIFRTAGHDDVWPNVSALNLCGTRITPVLLDEILDAAHIDRDTEICKRVVDIGIRATSILANPPGELTEDGLREVSEARVVALRSLSERFPSMDDPGAVLGFQLAYRLARKGDSPSLVGKWSEPVLVGILEAVGSADPLDPNDTTDTRWADRVELARSVMEQLEDSLESNTVSRLALMSYDVYIHYAPREGCFPPDELAPLREWGARHGLDDFVKAHHVEGAAAADPGTLSDELVEEYLSLREALRRVDEHTPSEHKRERSGLVDDEG